MRKLTINDPLFDITFMLPDDACPFCVHCSDFFYDYTHGPYLILCDIDKSEGNGTCECFMNRD